MATVAASTATHFLFNGLLYPVGWEVIAHQSTHALLKREGYRNLYVAGGSTVGGSVPANQAALVAALEAIVDGPGMEDIASAEEINAALKATAQPVTVESLPLPTGAATADGQVTAAEIDTALKATPMPVSGVVPTSTNAVRVAVGTSSGVLIATRATRRMLTISNPRSNTATIAFSTGAAALETSPNLEPGDSWSGETTAAFNAIASAACSVDVTETYS